MHRWAQSPLLDKHSSMSAGGTNTGDFNIYIWLGANIGATEKGVVSTRQPVVTWVNIFSSLEHGQESINR